MRRMLSALASGSLLLTGSAATPVRAGELAQVQAVVVDAPAERPGYRMRAVALKNLGEHTIRLVPQNRLMAARPEPDTCGYAETRDRTRKLRPGKTFVVPVLLYAVGEAPGSDDALWSMDSYVGVPVLLADNQGACAAPLVWTSSTLATPAFTVRGE